MPQDISMASVFWALNSILFGDKTIYEAFCTFVHSSVFVFLIEIEIYKLCAVFEKSNVLAVSRMKLLYKAEIIDQYFDINYFIMLNMRIFLLVYQVKM